ncbi:MAG: GntR family transcriptional regulator [Herpetosiphonaceae bacterium]|nr:GntR family transcriptional regulator [Herpetosiphonaceae bacterium]
MNTKPPTATIRDGQSVAALYDRLRTAILRGELVPGSSVSLPHLASLFGAGRTPLREVLRMLQGEGLVIAAPNQRVRIASLTVEDFEEIWIARLALEAVAIRLTVPTLRTTTFAALEGYMAQMEHYQKAGDQMGLRAPHRAFHHTLVAGAGPRLSAEIGELADHAERYRLRFGAFGSWNDRRAEHRAILDAAAAGDADGTANRLAEHYIRTILLLFGALDHDHDLGRLRATVLAVAPGAAATLQDG